MSLLSDLNNKIKALSTRVGTEVKSLWEGVNSKVADVVLDNKTLTVTKGDGTTAVFTTVDTNTTYSAMTGATASAAGNAGLVPAPAAGTQAKFLRGDGTWQTPTNTTYSAMTGATASAAGNAGLVPAPAAGKQTSFLRGDGTWVVPTNTTYTAGTGLSLSGTQFSLAASGVTAGSYGPSANASPAHKGTFSVPYVTVDTTGRVTGISTKTITLPADSNTDTKVTNTASNTTKFYITGTSSSSTNTGTQYFDTGVYVTATAGYLHCTRLEVGSGTIWVA